jgi:hypothetical protein
MSQVAEIIGYVEIILSGNIYVRDVKIELKLEAANYKNGYFLRDFCD